MQRPQPSQAELDRLMRGATALQVVDMRGMLEKPPVLYRTSRPEELAELRECLRIRDGGVGHCMCFGTVRFDLTGAEVAGEVTLHHGVTVRWGPFFDNADLVSPDAIMDWLTARGMSFVRAEYDDNRRQAAESSAAAERWQNAMPRSLRPFFAAMGEQDASPEWNAALAAEFPEPEQRTRVLLEWFGSGSGPWSGFPTYELVPQAMLLALPLDLLLRALDQDPRSDPLIEGTARLFGGRDFGRRRPDDLARIPAAIKKLLLEHSLRSGDDDKRRRARHAFRRRRFWLL